MNRKIRQQRERIGNRDQAVALVGGVHDIELADDRAIRVAEKRKARTQTGPEGGVDLRRIDARGRKLAIAYGQLFLELGQKAQLHLALRSPVTAIEDQDQRKLPGDLRKPHPLSFVIRKLDIRKRFADRLIHCSPGPRGLFDPFLADCASHLAALLRGLLKRFFKLAEFFFLVDLLVGHLS